MKFYLNQELNLTRENACILYTPQTMQHYEAVQKFRNSYIHFSCSAPLAEHFRIPLNTIFYPGNPDEIDEYIRKIQEERIASRPFAEEKEYFLLSEMLIAIARAMAGANTDMTENRELYEIFLSLRLDMLRSYEKPWTTEDLCRRANLEKSQFFACYQRFFQSTPHADLLSVRLEKAKNLLTNEALPINLAARQCGFSDITHCSRYFKKECGCSPKEYARRWKEHCSS